MVISPFMDNSTINTTLDTSENIKTQINEITAFQLQEGSDVAFTNSIPLPLPGSGATSDIISFLNRPISVANGTWSTASAFNVDLFDINIYGQLLSHTMWTSKIAGFRYLKYTSILKVIFNPSPFHAGSVYVWWNPIPMSLRSSALAPLYGMHTRDLIAKSQKPGVLYNCGEDSVQLTVPFVGPTMGIDREDSQRWDTGSITGTIASPLRTGTGASTVNWNAWLSFTDFELFGPYVPNGFSAKGGKKNTVSRRIGECPEEESPAPSISKMLSTTSSVFNSLSDIPLIGSFCAPAAWVTAALSGAASAVGWSKPDLQSSASFMVKNYHHGSANASGVNLSDKLSVMGDNFLTVNTGISFRDEDELSINFLKRQWSIFSRFGFSSTDNVGQLLFSFSLLPTLHNTNAAVTTSTGNTVIYNNTPVSFLGDLFQYWRGGFEYKFIINRTGYHAGTIVFSYHPLDQTVSYDNTRYLHKNIVDIQDGSEVCLTIPYVSTDPWKNNTESSGFITVHVVSPLRFPDTVASLVEILCYVRGAPDMEFTVPVNDPQRPVWIANGIDTMESGPICSGGIGSATQRTMESAFAEFCIGEKIMSLSSLLKRNVPLYLSNVAPATNRWDQSFSIQPYYAGLAIMLQVLGIYAKEQSNLVGDHYSTFAYMYMLGRGSLRFRVAHPSVANGLVSAALTIPSVTLQFVQGVQTLNDTDRSTICALPATYHQTTTEAGLSVQVPFYNKYYACAPTCSNGRYMPNYSLTVRHQTDPSPTWVMRSVGDDFFFAGFIGIPTMFKNFE
jgi:hypothetical protein